MSIWTRPHRVSKYNKHMHAHTHTPTHSYTTGTCRTLRSAGCQSGQSHTESVSTTNTCTHTHTHKPTHSYTTGTCKTLHSVGCQSGQGHTESVSATNKQYPPTHTHARAHTQTHTQLHNRHLLNTTLSGMLILTSQHRMWISNYNKHKPTH